MKVNNTPEKRLAMRKYSYVWILLLSLLLLSFGNNRVVAQQNTKHQVLVLNSYHQGFSWTDRIVAGIEEVFAEEGSAAELHIEYMDTKRLLSEAYLTDLYELYKDKYAAIPIDLIIVSDNNGLEFLRKYGKDLFPGIPIVFTGVNNFSDDLLNGFDQITGVAEETDIAATLELMLNLHPNTEQIYLLNDKTPTGVATLESFEKVRPQFEDRVEFVIFDDFAVLDMQQELATLPANSLILMLLVNRDNTGQFYTYEESLTLLSQNTQVPIYGIWDFYIGYGIVGGKLTDGTNQGRAAGEMAVRILQGESVANIPVLRESPNQYMFDYKQLQRFSIDTTQLPEDSLILNRTPTFYDLYETYIWIAAVVFAILTMAIVVLLINISRRQRVEKELQQSYARRGRQVKLSTQVTQDIIGITNLEELYRNIVQQVKEQFGYYHTQILQYDPKIEAVRLIAGYGDVGAQMLAEGHQLEMGQGLIGHAAATGETVLRSTLSNDPDWKPNPLLPETKGEIAVPITLGTEILGVLDVQSDEPGALNADDQLLLEGLCGQIAIAIENARQYDRLEQSQESIKERENLLHTIIDATPDWIFVKDLEHRYKLVNKGYADSFHMAPPDFIGKNDLDIGFPEEIVKGDPGKGIRGFWTDDREIMDHGELRVIDVEPAVVDGENRFLNTIKAPLKDDDGNVIGIVGFVHDITDRIKNEEAVRERELLLTTIIDSTPDWIFVKDLEHRYLVANKEFADTLETTPNEIIGKNDLEIGIPEEVVKGVIWPGERQVLDSGEMAIVEEETTLTTGRHVFLVTTRVPLLDAANNVSGFVGFVHDITNIKEAEMELQEAHARTQEILESLNVPLVISRVSDGIVAYVNEPMAEMIRVPREELIGQVTPDFYHDPADRDAYLKGLREQGYVSNFDLRLKRGDGDLLWTLVSGRVINFQGEPAIISSLMDITDRRDAEATIARRATELETVANVSTVAATAQEPEELMQQVVDLTKERFDLYHAHLYLLNESKTDLVLASGAGEIGAKMVAEGRRIALTQKQSLVARAAREQTGVVINDVQAEPGFLPHPLLPETRAEMAVPLVVGNEVLGVLDVQADEVERFTPEDINIFTTLASQIAVALQNARRHNEALRALDELTRLQRIMVREGWEDYLTTQERPSLGYAFGTKGVKPIQDTNKEVVSAQKTEFGMAKTETAVPIAIRGEMIGKIALRTPDGTAVPERKQSLIQTVAHQISEALERARLTAQTQQALAETAEQARRRAILNQTSEQLNRAETLDDIFQIIAGGTAQILPSDRVSLALLNEDKDSFSVMSLAGAEENVPVRIDQPLAGSFIEKAVRTGTVLVTHDDQPNPKTGICSSMVAPLVTGSGTIGTLNVGSKEDNVYTELDQGLILQIASILSSVIENKRLLTETQERAKELAMINRVVSEVSASLDIHQSLQIVADELAEATNIEAVAIALINDDQASLTVVAEHYNPEHAGSSLGFVIPIEGNVLTQEVLNTRRTVLVEDAQNNPLTEPVHEGMRMRGVNTLYIIPMFAGNEIIGTVGIDILEKDRRLTPQQLRLAETIIFQAATAVQNARLFTQTEQRAAELSLINAVSELASSQLELTHLFESVGDLLRDTFAAESIYFALYDKAAGQITFPYFLSHEDGWHEVAPRSLADGGFTGQIIESKASLLLNWESDVTPEDVQGQGGKVVGGGRQTDSYLGTPMIVGNEVIGVVALSSFQEVRTYNEQDQRLLETLADTIGVAIQNIRQFQVAQRRAEREALINSISQKIQSAPTVQSALQTAVSELGQALKLKKAAVSLTTDRKDNGHSQN